jgi:hypothetical protein
MTDNRQPRYEGICRGGPLAQQFLASTETVHRVSIIDESKVALSESSLESAVPRYKQVEYHFNLGQWLYRG